jgi:molecular chaperone HtpG
MSDVKPFEAEVSRVLDLVINSLYKERDIFLRELISNASDACDKVRYESLSAPELLGDDPNLKIGIIADEESGILRIIDNGIGMDREDLEENLGTIARSGTARFLEQASQTGKSDVQLIGQFGVGFYSVFMVADKVIVSTRKAGQDQGWMWASNGRDGYTVSEAEDNLPRGTTITLHLKEDATDFLDEWRIRNVVRKYSDHIALPIMLEVHKKPELAKEDEDQGEAETARDEPREPEQINNASALWTRPKSEITEEQYREFYHHTAHAFDDPFGRVHFNAEGVLSYTALLFMPSVKPFDLFDPKRGHRVKLYVKRVFIADDLEELLPKYLRFVAGVVDSEDLQLNVSRETLQHGAVVAKMRKAIVKRLLDEIARKAKEYDEKGGKEPENEAETAEDPLKPKPYNFIEFWTEFGQVLKEGIYEDFENREKILDLARFKSTHSEDWTSLADYIERMKEGQDAILYITGAEVAAMRNSPQLEEARAKGVEVLLLADPVDEFWVAQVSDYKDKSFKSLTKGDVDLSTVNSGEEDQKSEEEATDEADISRLIAALKIILGDDVKDIRVSRRLRDSAVCLVAEEGGMDMQMERFLKQHNQLEELSKRILEINKNHDLIKKMSDMAKDDGAKTDFDELARLLLDQARIIEGETIPDPGAFSRRMSSFLARGIAV